MKRRIKLHTGAYTEVDDSKRKIMTHQEWIEERKREFGENFMKCKFQCPMCGHIDSVQDFKDAGTDNPNCRIQRK